MRLPLAIFIFLALAVCVFADYPIELVQTIQLPPNTAWDVQHWMDDSTYGWACLNNDTIFYRAHLNDSTTTVPAPHGSSTLWGGPPPSRVVIFHSSLYPTTPTVAVMTRGADYSDFVEMDTLSRVLLPSGETFGPEVAFSAYHELAGGSGSSAESPQDLYCWPPTPLSAMGFICTRSQYVHNDGTGPNQEFWWLHGAIVSAGNAGILLNIYDVASSSVLSRYDSLVAVFTGLERFHGDCDQIPEPPGCQTYNSHSRFARVQFGQSYTARALCDDDTAWSCPNLGVTVQLDADGTERVILSDGTCHDPISFDTLWQNPSINGNPLSAGRMSGSADERVLSRTGTAFNIFNATTGDLLGATDSLIGSPQYLLKLPNRLCEIVTYDATRTVRIYRSAPLTPAAPESLTVAFVDSSNVLLRWAPVTHSDGGQPITPPTYIIQTAESADGPFIAFAAADSTSYLHEGITGTAHRQFYRVTAVTDNAAAGAILRRTR